MAAVNRRERLRLHSFWWLQAAGWGCFYLLSVLVVLPYVWQPGELGYRNVKGLLADQGLLCLGAFLASLALRPVCRALAQRLLSWFALEMRAAGCSLVIGTCVAVAASQFMEAKPEPIELLEACAKASVLLFLWCNLYFSIKQWQQHARETERLLRAEAEAHQSRLLALRYQLNPHFLFNSMNAVSTLVDEGNGAAATKMLAEIAEFLRLTLDTKVATEVPLSDEMRLTERYLAIEQVRFHNRLRVNLDASRETLEALVPSLLLQPLVENAIRHGIAPLVEGGTIAVRSELRCSRVAITISNSGRRDRAENGLRSTRPTGIGLTNTAARLETLYGPNHKFELEWPPDGGCRVIVEIPFRRCREGARVAACAS